MVARRYAAATGFADAPDAFLRLQVFSNQFVGQHQLGVGQAAKGKSDVAAVLDFFPELYIGIGTTYSPVNCGDPTVLTSYLNILVYVSVELLRPPPCTRAACSRT